MIWTAENIDFSGIPNYYDNDATKDDLSVSGKVQFPLGSKFRSYLDLQGGGLITCSSVQTLRVIPFLKLSKALSLIQRLGLNYQLGKNGQIYASYAVANKEPNRDDFTESTIVSRPRNERLFDTELGYRVSNSKIKVGVNAYHMRYKDQIVPTGQLNDVGAATRRNVEDSYRLGIEFQMQAQMMKTVGIFANATFSKNKIRQFSEFVDNWDYWNQDFENTPPEMLEPIQFEIQHEDTDLALSPNVNIAVGANLQIIENQKLDLKGELSGKYVGKQFLDNTSNAQSKLDPYFFADAQLNLKIKSKTLKNLEFTFLARNLFANLYSTNGWVYRFRSKGYDPRPDDPYVVTDQADRFNMIGYYPQAGRNFLFGLKIGI